ncbi:glycosyltransferase [Halosquirtibacter xylanolyticus]|uniref:glycosyltransferase n=1 Tax=Halosquirtibacter xylanolyticus TaxID=3374599 RepID=UPI00374962C7|nr:glycosyltransferase [Prolixibacteraceae bacterium]
MNLLVITSIEFPSPTAGANRIISYSKGLIEEGCSINVLSVRKKTISNIDRRIKIINTGGKSRGIILSLLSMFKYLCSNNYDYYLVVSNSIVLITIVKLASLIKRTKILIEKSEFPFVLMNLSLVGKIYSKFYIRYIYSLFDGMVIMTKPLIEYFQDKIPKKTQIFHLPMTVDFERFDLCQSEDTDERYIAYCGNMSGNKDGVLNLLDSFALFTKHYKDIRLKLIGGATIDELNSIKEYAKDQKRVDFYGVAEASEIPQLLSSAKLLVLARPNSLQSLGGFPSKLGEYLSTGNPVLVTKVGEIPNYLTDGVNAFLVEPDNNILFAKKMMWIFENYELAKKIGCNGKKIAKTTFSYKSKSKDFFDFLTKL